MKLVSWNVNGIRACIKKGFYDYFQAADADIFCIQETKMQAGQVEMQIDGYYQYMNCAQRKGYSGVMVFTKQKPLSLFYGLGIEKHDQEGRLLTLEYDSFFLVCCYTPNAKENLARLAYRMEWEDAFRSYVTHLHKSKPVIICGDLNVAHQAIDLKNPDTNHNSAGFSDAERGKLSELLDCGFIDTYRFLYPDQIAYSWWSYRFYARAKNAGWRIDYFLVSDELKDYLVDAAVETQIMGSDHCPVTLEIKLSQPTLL